MPSRLALAAVALVPIAHACVDLGSAVTPSGTALLVRRRRGSVFPIGRAGGGRHRIGLRGRTPASGDCVPLALAHPASRSSGPCGSASSCGRRSPCSPSVRCGSPRSDSSPASCTPPDSRAIASRTGIQYDGWSLLSCAVATVASGLLFGLAHRVTLREAALLVEPTPSGRRGAHPTRPFLVGLPRGSRRAGGVVPGGTTHRFDAIAVQFEVAALAGVAMTSGFRAQR